MGPYPIRIAIVGDIHHAWDARDVACLDAEGYDLVLFVGDLAGHLPRRSIEVGRRIAPLRTPALAIAGNHDCTVPGQGEVARLGLGGLARVLAHRMERDVDAMAAALGPVTLAAYATYRFELRGRRLRILVARPHSEGGPRLSFPAYLARAHGVRTMDDSVARLVGLLDALEPEVPLVVLAHNGPAGLGRGRGAIWGARPRRHDGDGGDPDLAAFLAHARAVGRAPRAVVAGHLHHQPRRGGPARPTTLERDGILYVNAAEVPRHRLRDGRQEAHHVALTLDTPPRATDRWLDLGTRG